ncbi:MAG: energy-coupling factor transporter transmembrane component T [Bryobacteraceae bacterium]|nr:energy-coupling factor transporter transmembrane component T [Bryobacteraceae bacterium]
MHYIVLDRLSRQSSYLHGLDARCKIAALILFLVAVATTLPLGAGAVVGYAFLLAAGVLLARLPPAWMLTRSAAVLPFTMAFATMSVVTGNIQHAVTLVAKSYLSSFAVLLVVASTPLPALLDGFGRLGVPVILVTVIQFLYRYLFVITDEARRMWLAAQLRGSALSRQPRSEKVAAAAGSLAVLFARSLEKAESIHLAMTARGFSGRMPALVHPRATAGDALFLLALAALLWLVRFRLGGT